MMSSRALEKVLGKILLVRNLQFCHLPSASKLSFTLQMNKCGKLSSKGKTPSNLLKELQESYTTVERREI